MIEEQQDVQQRRTSLRLTRRNGEGIVFPESGQEVWISAPPGVTVTVKVVGDPDIPCVRHEIFEGKVFKRKERNDR